MGVLLLAAGLWQQVNLILLVFTLSAGPFLASIFGGRAMLRRLSVVRRLPAYVFSGDPLVIDYTLENGRRWFARPRGVPRRFAGSGRSLDHGSGQRDASGFLREGRRPRSGADPLGVPESPGAASIGFAIWMWAPALRSGWSSIVSRSRCPTRSWFIPPSAV